MRANSMEIDPRLPLVQDADLRGKVVLVRVDHNVVKNGEIAIAPVMYLALSYDHRIIDGKESVGFLVAIKEALENPVEHLMSNDIKKALEL